MSADTPQPTPTPSTEEVHVDATENVDPAKPLTANQKKNLKKKLAKQRKKENEGNGESPSEGSTNNANKEPLVQTNPPSIPVHKLFTNGKYPVGELQEYNPSRNTSEEKRHLEKLSEPIYEDLRRAAEVHRTVRKYVQETVKPGMKMMDIVNMIESGTKQLVAADGLKRGWGFPTGVSLNNCAAHWTPNPGDNTVLKADDVMKVDFGVHVNGRIIDCAWTMSFDSKYDKLLQAVKDATNTGVKEAGIDVRVGDIGAAIQEVMESYEIELNGKVYPIKAIENLQGHSIMPYVIHAGKSVPIVKRQDNTKMEEGDCFAIETFGSTGKGYVNEGPDCSHYMIIPDANFTALRQPKTRALLAHIKQTFDTLPFCRRWLEDAGQTKHLMSLKQLVDAGIVSAHPPLLDVTGSYTAQFEHTLFLKPTCKEVFSRGEDY